MSFLYPSIPVAVLLAPAMGNEDTTSDFSQRWKQITECHLYILIIVSVNILSGLAILSAYVYNSLIFRLKEEAMWGVIV